MNKRLMAVLLILLALTPQRVSAADLRKAEATCYILDGITAAGTQTRTGIVASKHEYLGMVMMIWLDNGDGLVHPENFIGTYIVEDSGSEPIREGRVLDIWVDNEEDAWNFGRKNVIYQVIDCEG